MIKKIVIEYKACCSKCGRKRYKIKREAYGITIHQGTCTFCKKKKWLIPAVDWAWMTGDTEVLD